jgi:hypothetical protein
MMINVTLAGCTSNNLSATLTDPNTPTLSATGTNPTTCGGSDGEIDLTFTNVPNGTYTINYVDGSMVAQSFTGVSVTLNTATVSGLTAGDYNDLSITVSGCTSTEDVDITLTDPNTPTLSAVGTDPTTCGGSDGEINFTFSNVPDGTYTINYVDGSMVAQSFTGVSVTSNTATVSGLTAGDYNDLSITVSGCTSTEDVDITLTDPNTPTLSAVGTDPTTCGGTNGEIEFTFTNVPDGTYTINYVDGSMVAQSFTGVRVT